MGDSVNDKTLAYYVMGLQKEKEKKLIEARLKKNSKLAQRLSLFEQGLSGKKHKPMDISQIWERISKNIKNDTKNDDKKDSALKILQFPKKSYKAPLSIAAGFIAFFIAIKVFLPFLEETKMWKFKQKPEGVNITGLRKDNVLIKGSEIRVPYRKKFVFAYNKKTKLTLTGPAKLSLHTFKKGRQAKVLWNLHKGKLDIKVEKKSFSEFKLFTSHVSVSVIGTCFTMLTTPSQTTVTVRKGKVSLALKNKKMIRILTHGRSVICTYDSFKEVKKEDNKECNKKVIKKGFKEIIFLHDGSIFKGKIVSQTKKIIIIKTKRGSFKIERNKIKNVRYK